MKKNYALIILLASFFAAAQTPGCDNTTVYAVGNSFNAMGYSIHKLTKSVNGGLTYNNTVAAIPIGSGTGLGLAIADFGNGNHFYTSDYNGNVLENSGSSWNTLATSTNGTINNPAGKGAYLYFQKNNADFTRRSIVRYADGTITEIWNDESTYMTIADMAVDDDGNLYFFSGVDFNTNYMTDTLNVLSPDGTILNQYAISFDSIGGYGMCFLGGNLYVFFTSSNSSFPGKMTKFSYAGTTATASTTTYTIPTPVVGTTSNGQILLFLQDVATCSTSKRLAVDSFENELVAVVNSGTSLSIQSPISGNASIYNQNGQEIMAFPIVGTAENKIDIANLTSGIYLLILENDGKKTTKKFMKN